MGPKEWELGTDSLGEPGYSGEAETCNVGLLFVRRSAART